MGSAKESQGRGAGRTRCLGCMPRLLSRGGQGWAHSILRSGTGVVVLGKVLQKAEKLRCGGEGSGTRSAACIERMKRPEKQLCMMWLAAGGGGGAWRGTPGRALDSAHEQLEGPDLPGTGPRIRPTRQGLAPFTTLPDLSAAHANRTTTPKSWVESRDGSHWPYRFLRKRQSGLWEKFVRCIRTSRFLVRRQGEREWYWTPRKTLPLKVEAHPNDAI